MLILCSFFLLLSLQSFQCTWIVAYHDISTGGVWPQQTFAPAASDRPWTTSSTCVLWQSSKAAYNLCTTLAITEFTGWITSWLQRSQNEINSTSYCSSSNNFNNNKNNTKFTKLYCITPPLHFHVSHAYQLPYTTPQKCQNVAVVCQQSKTKLRTFSWNRPIDPVPSMMAVTVASAILLPWRLGCVPRSADTAVVIRQYGPLTSDPQTASSTATYFITSNAQNRLELVHKCHLTLINIINVKKRSL